MRKIFLILSALAILVSAAFAEIDLYDRTELIEGSLTPASTVAWGDIDNNGTPDLFIGGTEESPSKLLLNYQGTFMDVTQLYSLNEVYNVRSAQFVDFDRDGRLDLFCLMSGSVARETGPHARLYRLTPSGRYQYLPIHGLEEDAAIRNALWTDMNEDGQLELLVSNTTVRGPLMPYEQSSLDFIPMRDMILPDDLVDVGAMTVVDYDVDGDMDLFFGTREYGEGQCHFYRNENGRYIDVLNRMHFPDDIGNSGACWADFNNDGYPDLFVPGSTAMNTHLLISYINGNNGVDFYDRSSMPGLRGWQGGVYACPVDANVDGWTDLFITRSDGRGNVLLLNNRFRDFKEVALDLNLRFEGVSHQVCAWADFDNDGDPDLALAQGESGVRLYRNDSKSGHEFVSLNLLGCNRDTPKLNCSVKMIFEYSKRTTTTSHAVCSPGCDGATLNLVSPTLEKSGSYRLIVDWPLDAEMQGNFGSYAGDLIRVEYDEEDFRLNRTITLHAPQIGSGPPTASLSTPVEERLSLSNSPNPFNPSTQVSFTLPEATDIRLSVYNLLGREVATLAAGRYQSGTHTVTFDASALPSGLYISRIQAGHETQMRRMLLTK